MNIVVLLLLCVFYYFIVLNTLSGRIKMEDGRTFLKVKIKSLAAEAKIIRKEEKKNTKIDEDLGYNRKRRELRDHRKGTVAYEARHTLLAYGFIRGRAYEQMEPTGSGDFNVDKVWKMIEKYGKA